MSVIGKAVDIADLGQRNLWVLYGKSGTGKTHISSTFPKPLLYLQVGDDGSNTISHVKGVRAVPIKDLEELKTAGKELIKDTKYKSVVVDTFSMITNIWIDENATSKNRKMSQQMWGDLKNETEELIRTFHEVAESHNVILTCHEATDLIEGLEDELLPDVRPSTTRGARTYLEGMSNYGIHTTKVKKDIIKDGVEREMVRYAAHVGANPYYWTKLQINPSITVPKLLINPTYSKIIKIIEGGK